MMTAFS